LTVLILLAIALASIIGTLIPQNENPADYIHAFGEFKYLVMDALDLFDMYHAWWYQMLLFFLTVNIIVCSFNRLSSTWKIIFPKKKNAGFSKFSNRKPKHEFSIDQETELVEARYKTLISKAFGPVISESEEDGFVIYGEKGRWTRLGVYIIHTSVLFLLIGAMVGAMFGFEGRVNIPEGEAAQYITLMNTQEKKPLDFAIRCNDFSVTYYKNNPGMPEEFRSSLSIIENNEVVHEADIIVNAPLRYKGINIFQSNYGTIPMTSKILEKTGINLRIKSNSSGMLYTVNAKKGKEIDLPEGLGRLEITGYQKNHMFRGMSNIGQVFTARLKVSEEDEPIDIIISLKFPNFDKMRKGSFIVSAGESEHYFTGLQITSDPGVGIVYIGFVMMIIGFFITFFMSHQQIYVRLARQESNTRVTILGKANKNRLGMDIFIRKLSERLQKS
ncbi:cytochrome c biogenesis protein ResB, partial [Desulfobacterales bacterium HSG16]|nr:cytochrome c biogenesis protein ResB [Desulfobacterales bacterium HSG16]